MSDVIQKHQEIKQSRVIIDPRSFRSKIWDSLQKPWIPFGWAIFATCAIIAWPGCFLAVLIVQLILWLAVVSKPDVLPIHLPIGTNKEDRNDPKPGDGKGFYKARGSFLIGRIRGTGTEVWLSFKALTQHFLLFGTTGSGKTESIVSYIINYLSVGSAVAFNDAKAAPRAMLQIATFCRIFGRDDDFRVTNYIKAPSSARMDPAERSSNDAAVFARGSAESSTQMLVSLIPASKGENQVFSEKAVAMVSAIMPGLTDLRDRGILQIDPSVIRRYLSIQMFAELYRSNNISKRSRDALEAFLLSLPGYKPDVAIQSQPEEVARQFGFGQAYFTRSLASLSDTYGHIYLVGQGEIDYQDAVLNGRMLMTLLPSMAKSGEELNNLGKIVLTAIRNGMVVGLGTVFEGSVEDMALNLPTNSDIPYGIKNDENAYMLIEGQEMLNAQARGLGFGILTGTQDISGMLLNLEKTTKQIMSNSAIKQFMFLDDKDTTDLAVEFSGEATVMARGRYEIHGDLGTFYAAKEANTEKRFRLNATALKKLGLGQAYILYQGNLHEVQVFNHGISEEHSNPLYAWVPHWYSVRMAKVRVPTQEALDGLMAAAPLPEWRDLKIMLSDTSRAMLKEMSIYFASIVTIQRMARQYQNNQAMLGLAKEVYGAATVLEVRHEEPSGLLKTICSNPPASYRDTYDVLMGIARSHEAENTKLVAMADKAGLDALDLDLPGSFAPPFAEDDTGRSGGQAGGGGGARPAAAARAVDVLDGYLSAPDDDYGLGALSEPPAHHFEDMPGTSNYNDVFDEYVDAPEPAVAAPASYLEQPSSEIGEAVHRNLANMPWMAGVVDYQIVESALTKVESFFDENPQTAAASVASGMEELGMRLKYPETRLPDDHSVEKITGLLKNLSLL